jgi:isopentenyldiphosphate isomerase
VTSGDEEHETGGAEERFDLYTREGVPLGRSKPRRLVHRDGDWHRSVHIWVWGIHAGAPHLVFQRRARTKDTWPGVLDVAVTGHARAGEALEATLREADEEIGLSVAPEDVVRLGLRRRAERRPGVHDNELQEIFARVAPAALEALRPDPVELDGLVVLPLDDAERVLGGDGAAVARRVGDDGDDGAIEVSARDFVPAPDGYYAKACASVRVMLARAIPEPWEIG